MPSDGRNNNNNMTYYSALGIKEINVCPVEMTEAMKLETAERIIVRVAKFYDVEIGKVKSKGRSGLVPRVRQIASWMINKKVKGLALKQVSRLFGNAYLQRTGEYDHTAIIHNIKKVNGWVKVGDSVVQDITNLMAIL